MTDKKKFDLADLRQFTGSDTWYRHGLNRNVTYTVGAQYVAETAGAYWLLDMIAINQMDKRLKKEEFQVWILKRDAEGSGAWIYVEDGNDNRIFEKHIEFTDFPAPEFKFWFTDNVIMLPSEY